MNSAEKTFLGLGIISLIVVGVFGLDRKTEIVVVEQSDLGSGSGQEHYFKEFFLEGVEGNLKEEGIKTTLTATTTAQVLNAAQV